MRQDGITEIDDRPKYILDIYKLPEELYGNCKRYQSSQLNLCQRNPYTKRKSAVANEMRNRKRRRGTA